ncbi:MAG: beta-galactosidase, partial [Armatimonadetes bacterium]|nr:beta-galactosidase [Armatimonadota bacterium]
MKLLPGVIVLVSLCAVARAGGFRRAEVKIYRGAPQLVVDGKPVVPLSFMGWYGASAKRVNAGLEWRRFTVVFTAPENCEGQAGFQIRILKGGAGKVWIDDLRYYEGEPGRPVGDNMQPSGDFEDTGDQLPPHWGLFFREQDGAKASWAYDTSTAASGKRSLRIDVEKNDPRGWLHIYLSGSSVREGRTYTVEVSLRADPPREIELAALHQGPPWTPYGGGEDCVYIQQVKLAAAAGIHIHQFGTSVPWPRPGETPSYASLDSAMRDTIKADPDAVVMLRIGVEPPAWWLEEHPEETTTYEDGTKSQVSACSELWISELEPKLEAFVRHCEEKWGDRLLVYFPCGQHTGEWFYPGVWTQHFPGFSPAAERGFRRWLEKKYGSPQALARAWGRQIDSFDEVKVPTVEE